MVALRDRREAAIARISDAFARDLVEMDEFERRLTLAHRAESVADLDKLVHDLEPAKEAAAPSTALAPAHGASLERVRDRQKLIAIFGGVQRSGTWTPARHIRVVTVMGGAQLDFREAAFPAGVTELSVFSLMGGAQIIVPPNLAVEMEGTAIMGGFDHADRAPPHLDPDRPLLRVRGFAMMGGVQIETRLPGESEREAHRRRRSERRARRHAERDR
jgi:hypothetical protein